MKKHGFWRRLERKYILYPLVLLAKGIMRFTLWTCRIEIEGLSHLTQTAKRERCIIMLWHNRIAIMSEILAAYAPHLIFCAFVSKSRDGEFLAVLAHTYSTGRALRVPYNTRHKALGTMISRLKLGKEVMIMTPDGPRGPRYSVKPGVVLAAKKSSAKIIALTWSSSHFWQISSWDKLILPKPFSTIRISLAAPRQISDDCANSSDEAMALQSALCTLDAKTCGAVSRDASNWPK